MIPKGSIAVPSDFESFCPSAVRQSWTKIVVGRGCAAERRIAGQ
jgi:hypothetical protein